MTDKEKAKRFDEAIKNLKGMIPSWERLSYNGKTFLQDLFYILPELKESEDEKIRKEITGFFKNYSENGTWKAIPDVTKWIAWLEKVCNIIKEWGDLKVRYIQDDLQQMVELKQKARGDDERIRKRLMEWVEEFRKLNPTNADHNAECSEALAWLEKQGE